MHNPYNLDSSTLAAQAFDQQHGQKIQINGRWFYEDGAIRDCGPYGASRTPSDPKERDQNIIAHHEEHVRRARVEAEIWEGQVKQRLTAAKNRPWDPTALPPGQDELDKLERLIAHLRTCEGRLAQARANAQAAAPKPKPTAIEEFTPSRIDAADARLKALRF